MAAPRNTSLIRRELFRIGRLAAGRRAFSRLSRASGVELSQQEVQVLMALAHRGAQSIGGIARTAHMEKAAVSRNVSRLRDGGLVTTAADDRKGSVVIVTMSPAGEEITAKITYEQDDYLRSVLGEWSDADVSTLGDVLRRLADDLEARLDAREQEIARS